MAFKPGFEGGCFCGAVRFRATQHVDAVSICHCEHCRRSSGAPFMAWVEVRLEDFVWTRGSAAAYHHVSDWPTPITRRFCDRCGTSLTYEREGSDRLDVSAASLDDPVGVTPNKHVFACRRLPWIELADDLPRHARLPDRSK